MKSLSNGNQGNQLKERLSEKHRKNAVSCPPPPPHSKVQGTRSNLPESARESSTDVHKFQEEVRSSCRKLMRPGHNKDHGHAGESPAKSDLLLHRNKKVTTTRADFNLFRCCFPFRLAHTRKHVHCSKSDCFSWKTQKISAFKQHKPDRQQHQFKIWRRNSLFSTHDNPIKANNSSIFSQLTHQKILI